MLVAELNSKSVYVDSSSFGMSDQESKTWSKIYGTFSYMYSTPNEEAKSAIIGDHKSQYRVIVSNKIGAR